MYAWGNKDSQSWVPGVLGLHPDLADQVPLSMQRSQTRAPP